ncbi:MAG: type II CAAX prenyl endopeptidase Rce1 family protein [Promethearchaeota archaeon]
MNEKENFNELSRSNLKWAFCPICGTKIPEIENIQFCIKCGVDLQYINTHMRMPPRKDVISVSKPYTSKLTKPKRKRISEDDLLNLEDKKLWGPGASIGITMAAFALMNMVAFIGVFIFVFFLPSLEEIYNIIESPYFIIFSSFVELIFFIVPFLYVGKYLERPNLNNRLVILGFSKKGFKKFQLIKEIIIGLVFAIIGVVLVFSVSIGIEMLTSLIFGSEVVSDILGTPSEVDMVILSSDAFSITLLVIIMILIIGTSEEVLFRGFLQKGLVRSIGKPWGILVTALIFASIHLIGIFLFPGSMIIFVVSLLLNFFPYFAVSLLLGLLFYWRKENLVAVMITHGVYNALLVIIAFLTYSVF